MCVLQSVLQHPAVGECAVVGLEDTLKGHVPLALCVLKNGEARQMHGQVIRNYTLVLFVDVIIRWNKN